MPPAPPMPSVPPAGTPPQNPPMWKRWWAWVAFVVVALLVIGGLDESGKRQAASTPSATASPPSPSLATLGPSPTPSQDPDVKAPSVLGLKLSAAKAAYTKAAKAAGSGATLFAVGGGFRYSSQPRGTVVAVNPNTWAKKGTRIPSGSTVFLILAKPIPTVPYVLNEQAKKAAKELRTRGYTVRTKTAISSQPKGRVLAQSVPGGKTAIPDQTTIVLTVAKPAPGYFITVLGSGSALVTWGNIGSTHQVTVGLPFTARVSTNGSFDVITVLAQRSLGDGGSITCEIIYSGRAVKKSTSSGAYSICSATANA